MAGTSGSPSCASELEDQLDRIELKARYARRYSDHRATPLLGALAEARDAMTVLRAKLDT